METLAVWTFRKFSCTFCIVCQPTALADSWQAAGLLSTVPTYMPKELSDNTHVGAYVVADW